MTVSLKNTWSGNLPPKQMFGIPPAGTTYVTYVQNTWVGKFYAPDGTLLCIYSWANPTCSNQQHPNTSNGGTIWITFLVSGATTGEYLTQTYSFNIGGQLGTNSTTFQVQ